MMYGKMMVCRLVIILGEICVTLFGRRNWDILACEFFVECLKLFVGEIEDESVSKSFVLWFKLVERVVSVAAKDTNNNNIEWVWVCLFRLLGNALRAQW
jgi:hypothetical protein